MALLQAYCQMPEKHLTVLDVWRAIVQKIKCCPMFNHLFNSHTGNLTGRETWSLGALLDVLGRMSLLILYIVREIYFVYCSRNLNNKQVILSYSEGQTTGIDSRQCPHFKKQAEGKRNTFPKPQNEFWHTPKASVPFSQTPARRFVSANSPRRISFAESVWRALFMLPGVHSLLLAIVLLFSQGNHLSLFSVRVFLDELHPFSPR